MFLDIFNSLIDIIEKINTKKVIIWGSGLGGKKTLFYLLQMGLKPSYFVDPYIENDNEKAYLNYKILNPKTLLDEDKNKIVVLIASKYDKVICDELKEMGFKKNKHFFSILFDSEKDDMLQREKEKEINKEKKKKEREQEVKKKKEKNCSLNSYVPTSAVLGKNVQIANHVTIEKNVKIGNYSYILGRSFIGAGTKVGKYCSIAVNVAITPTQHPKNFLSTSPILYSAYKETRIEIDKGTLHFCYTKEPQNIKTTFQTRTPAIVGNDVWISRNVVVQDNIKIGDGAIIGAGAIVTSNIPPYAIAVGVPARIIGYRFSEDIIKQLLKLKWWNMKEDLLKDLPTDIQKCIKILNKRKNLSTKFGSEDTNSTILN